MHNLFGSTTTLMQNGDCLGANESDWWSAIGYGDNKVVMISSDLSDWFTTSVTDTKFCSVFEDFGVTDAVRLDGGAAAGLYYKGNQVTGTHINPMTGRESKLMGYGPARYIAYAIGLVENPYTHPDGIYCGQADTGQNIDTLYSYTNGKYEVYRRCAHGCNQDTNICKSALSACPLGNGLYCGGTSVILQSIGLWDIDMLYSCKDGTFWEQEQCAYGCEEMASGENDRCRQPCPSGNGLYCGSSVDDSSLDGNMLYYCKDGVFQAQEPCANGCEVMSGGVNDRCKSGSNPEESFTCTSGFQTQTWQGRVWQRCDDGKLYFWNEAKAYCENLVLGGFSDWRLPTNDELRNLVVCTNGTQTPLAVYPADPAVPYSCDSHNSASYVTPTISSDFVCKAEPYWSSSLYQNTSYALTVDFYHGWSSRENPTTNQYYVRCVR